MGSAKSPKLYPEEMKDLLSLARILGVNVKTKKNDTFNLDTLGLFDPTCNQITLIYETVFQGTAVELHTLAHEIRHFIQFKSGLFTDYWFYDLGAGPRPPEEVKDALEDDADAWADAWLKGRGIKVPKG